jgi:5-(hydroxymethyl)furfural/furfural oxidase
MPFIADMNGEFVDGYGALPIAGTAQRRASSAISYLTSEVRRRRNLTILPHSLAVGLVCEGTRVIGVRVETRGASRTFRARETILTMGALLTPHFLLREGFGEPRHLQAMGVAVRAAIPGVGANLQNHATVLTLAHLRRAAIQRRPQRNHNNTIFRYSSGAPDCGASDMAIAVSTRVSWHAIARRLAHFSPILMAPASRGRVSLNGQVEAPLVEYNLLGDAKDKLRLIDGLQRVAALTLALQSAEVIGPAVAASRLANAARFNARTVWNDLRARGLAAAFDYVPGLGDRAVRAMGERNETLLSLLRDREQVSDFVTRTVIPLGHHSGTCRMGDHADPTAVVDPEGKVRGVTGLRVADGSVMPTVPRGNTNLPVLMIAEKLADAILDGRSA